MFPPLPPPNVNVPIPDPGSLAGPSPEPDPIQGALSIMAPLFALGTAFGGGPQAGAALLHGTHGAMQEREKQRQVKANQDAQIQLRRQQLAETVQAHQAAEEAKRAAGVQKLIADTAEQLKGAKTRDEYEQLIGASEQLGGYFFGLPPNKLRGILPYRAPNATAIMEAAGKKFLSNPVNQQAIADGKLDGVVMVDVQGDGIPVPVPVRDVLKAAGTMFDPQSGAPIVGAKPKAGGVQMDDEAFLGEVAKFEAEKGRPATPQERGAIAQRVIKAIGEARRAPPAAGSDGGLKDYQKFTAGEKLADKWTKTNGSLREMNRQFGLMQTGLNRFKAGDKIGGAQAVLVTFQKMLDPTSVVRESEFARSAAGLSFISRLEGYAERLASGGAGVPLSDMAAMVETARQFLDSMKGYTDGQRRRIGASAQQYGIDPALVFDDLTPDAGGKDPVKTDGFSVTAPNGKTYTFASRAQLDAFKRAAGIQ